MKNLFEYIIKDKDGNETGYDYECILKDFLDSGLYSNESELFNAVLRFGRGHFIPNKVREAYNNIQIR